MAHHPTEQRLSPGAISSGCLLCSVAGAAGVLADTGADAPPEDVLARALEANRQLARLVEELRTYPASDGLRAGIGSGILRQPTPNSVTVPRQPSTRAETLMAQTVTGCGSRKLATHWAASIQLACLGDERRPTDLAVRERATSRLRRQLQAFDVGDLAHELPMMLSRIRLARCHNVLHLRMTQP